MVKAAVEVHDDGHIEAKSKDAMKLVRVLGLDDPEYQEFRRLWIGIIAMAKSHKPDLFKQLMQYPNKLPNLKILRPIINTRPDGRNRSYFVLRALGKLPETY